MADDDDLDHQQLQQQQHQEEGGDEDQEIQRFFRLVRFLLLSLAFWFLIVYLIFHHDYGLVYILMTLFGMGLLYVVSWICFMIFNTTPASIILSSNQEYEMTQQQDGSSNTATRTLMTNKDDINNNSNLFVFPYRFEDTPRRIRDCTEIVSPTGQHHVPQNGKYKIVVTAIIFGKQVRSEGILHLKFVPSNTKDSFKNTGWNIQGSSIFGVTTTSIQDGFINAEGRFYWILPVTSASSVLSKDDKNNKGIQQQDTAVIYRGIIDMEDMDTFTFEDGEFQSLKETDNIADESSSSTTTGTSRRSEGRIVRFEYLGDDEEHDDYGQVTTPTPVLDLV